MESNILLRPITISDTPYIVEWRNNKNVICNFIDQTPLTDEIHNKWFSSQVLTRNVYQYIIHYIKDEIDIGSVFLKDVCLKHNKAEFGIFIGNDNYRKLGLGTEATKGILKIAFQELNLHKIYLRVLEENIYAIKAYKKVGFVQAGILKDDVYNNNIYQNVVLMEIINYD